MTAREWITEIFGEDLIVLDPPEEFDRCIVGVVESKLLQPVVVYDAAKITKNLMKQGMTTEEAIEYFEYNILDCYMGERTPMFLVKLPKGLAK